MANKANHGWECIYGTAFVKTDVIYGNPPLLEHLKAANRVKPAKTTERIPGVFDEKVNRIKVYKKEPPMDSQVPMSVKLGGAQVIDLQESIV